MPGQELLTCDACTARFDVDQVMMEEPDPHSDNATQYGYLAGCCPECGAELQLTLQDLQGFLTRGGPTQSS